MANVYSKIYARVWEHHLGKHPLRSRLCHHTSSHELGRLDEQDR
jgi:hypothetical protein